MHGWMSVPQHLNRLQEWHEVMKDISCERVGDLLDASRRLESAVSVWSPSLIRSMRPRTAVLGLYCRTA